MAARQRRPVLVAACRRRCSASHPAAIASGRAFAAHVEAETGQSRAEAVAQSSQHDTRRGRALPASVPCSRPATTALWIEDIGRWFAGADGKPQRAHGVVRRIDERHERERELERACQVRSAHRRAQSHRADRGADRHARAGDERRGSCGFLLASIDHLGTPQRILRLRHRRGRDRAGRQAAARAAARQGSSRPFLRQQVRHRADELHAGRIVGRGRASARRRARRAA